MAKPDEVHKLKDILGVIGEPIAFYPSFGRAFGSVKAGVFLCQFLYWENKQKDKTERWIYKTMEEIQKETSLTKHEQAGARIILEKEYEVLITKKRGVPPRTHYKFDWDKVHDIMIASAIKEGRLDAAEETIPRLRKVIDHEEMVQPLKPATPKFNPRYVD